MLDFPGTPRYRVIRRLGEGGMGVVYEAVDTERQQNIALKTLLNASPGAIYRFKQEFRALADVSHRNLVTLHELVKQEDMWFFTMELVSGATFLNWCRGPDSVEADAATELMPTIAAEHLKLEPVPIAPVVAPSADGLRRLRIALNGLAEGLVVLHDAGKLHRDVKPSNVLIDDDARVVLLDFGLSADLADGSASKSDAGSAVGTIAYMAPELTTGAQASAAADWYAVGTMLYQALTGRLPFTGTVEQVVDDRLNQEPLHPSELLPDLPPDLVRLCVDLLARRPTSRPNGRDVLRRLGARPPPRRAPTRPMQNPEFIAPFIGRRQELERLMAAWQQTQAGQTTVVHLRGAAGVGKSALLRQFVRVADLAHTGWALAGRCYEHELVPYKAVDSLIDDLSRQLRSLDVRALTAMLPPGVGALARLFPTLNRVESIRARGARMKADLPPDQLRLQAFAALRSLLFALARSRPPVMLIDDLQFGDADSAALLAHTLAAPKPPPVLLVLAYPEQTDRNHPLLAALDRSDVDGFEVIHIDVEPLDQASAESLAAALLAPEWEPNHADDLATSWPTLSPTERQKQARTVAEESEGIPLFIHELAHHARGELTAMVDQSPPELSIDAVVRRRAETLPAASQALLEVLAVADRPTRPDVALRAAGVRAPGESAITELVRSHLIKRSTSRAIELFHRRVGVAVRAQLSGDQQRHHHERLAAALIDVGDTDPTQLITHLAGAGQPEHAAEAARRAAEQPAESGATARPPTRRGTSRGRRAAGFNRQKEHAKALEEEGRPEAAEAYLEAARLTKDVRRQREMRRRAADQLMRFGRVADGLPILKEILQDLDIALPGSRRRTMSRLTIERAKLIRRGLEWTEVAPNRLNVSGVQRTDACWTVAVGLSMVDPVTAALYSTRYLSLALDLGDPNRIARALSMELALLTAEGTRRGPRLRRVLDTLRGIAKRLDAPYVRGFAALGAGLAALHEGRWAETVQCCRNAERVLRAQCTGVDWEITTAQALQLWGLSHQGQFEGLRPQLDAYVGHATASNNLHGVQMLRLSYGCQTIWLADDDTATATQQLEEAHAQLPDGAFHLAHFWAVASQTQLDLYEGHGIRAFRRITQPWPALMKSGFMTVQMVRVEALYLRARASLASVREHASQRPLLAQARIDAQHLIDERVPWSQALGHLLQARIHAGLGLVGEALEALNVAEAACVQADMKGHAAVVAVRRAELESSSVNIVGLQTPLSDLGIRRPSAWVSMLAP